MELESAWPWRWKMVMMIAVVLLSSKDLRGSSGCWEEERAALLQLKASINIPYDKVLLSSWKEDDKESDCCAWQLVSCGSQGRVLSLELLFIRVREWHLNASVFLPFHELRQLNLAHNKIISWTEDKGCESLSSKLKNLEVLDLGGNNLDMRVLSNLGTLSSLKRLDLYGNSLTGSLHLHELEPLQNLEELDLSWNSLDSIATVNGSKRRSSSLKNLKLLHLGLNDFHNDVLSNLSVLPSLQNLFLDNNKLKGSIRVQDIEALENLVKLDLSHNEIRSFVTTNGSEILSRLKNLKVLYLSDNDLTGPINLQGWLCQLRNLQALFVSANGLSGILPECLLNMTALRTLDLSQNQLFGNIVKSPLTNLTLLEYLSLSGNYFQLPHSLSSFSNHSNLKVFLGDNNKVIPDPEIQSLVPKFQLQVLSLSNCTLIGSPPNFLYHQRDLRIINLSHNSLHGSFPSWLIENNTQLNSLFFKQNLLTGPFRLPLQPHYLSTISISNNNMAGNIPTNMSQILPILEWLDMSSNFFNGNIPSCFCDMKYLKILLLSDNHLSGRLSQHIKSDSLLMILDVSNNALDGPITSISNLSAAVILSLQGNFFSGTIPSTFYSGQLAILDISNNHLSGELPRFTTDLTNLVQVDMSKNQLEGPIPNQYCKLSSTALDISDNKLSGSVPSCLLSTLSYLRLSNNKLSGSMAHVIPEGSDLGVLDLSHNNLIGSIPKGIHNLKALRILILGSNQFEGQIPAEICKLSQLSMLDLSKNDLSGPIPSCLNRITFQPDNVEADKSLTAGFLEFSDGITELQVSIKSLWPVNVIYFNLDYTYSGDSILKGVDFGTNSDAIQERVKFTTKGNTYSYEGSILGYMTGIDLSCNALNGGIPPEIGSLIGIHALNLSHNKLTGSIPKTLSNLSQIESLDLSYNSLNGSIPFQLIKLKSLEVFSLAHNNLSGKTPDFSGQFATFGESSYEGNPFLCGPPLLTSCYENGSTSSMPDSKEEEEEDIVWIDMDIFCISFWVSYGTIFLAAIAILLINSHWRRTWFYHVEAFITRIYYFVADSLRKPR